MRDRKRAKGYSGYEGCISSSVIRSVLYSHFRLPASSNTPTVLPAPGNTPPQCALSREGLLAHLGGPSSSTPRHGRALGPAQEAAGVAHWGTPCCHTVEVARYSTPQGGRLQVNRG